MQQCHRIDLEILIQDLGIDLHEVAESAADRVVDQHLRRAEFGAGRLIAAQVPGPSQVTTTTGLVMGTRIPSLVVSGE